MLDSNTLESEQFRYYRRGIKGEIVQGHIYVETECRLESILFNDTF